MAYLYSRREGRVEIRESHATPRGPRSRTLVSFRGPLTDELLERAETAASRPFDRGAITLRARELGIPFRGASADAPARALFARLREGAPLDPRLAALLRAQLDRVAAAPVPEDLADVAEWIGASEARRGRALRDVLRLYDTIARSRDPVPVEPPRILPRLPRASMQRDAS